MTHDSPDPHGDGTMGSVPSQGIFIGYMAIVLLGVALLLMVVVLMAAGSQG